MLKINDATMKFNEYAIVSKELENQGSSIDEMLLESQIDLLAEATNYSKKYKDNKLDTGGSPKWLSPKNAIKRKKIVNNAYKYLDYAKEKIIDKTLPGILKSFKEFASKGAALSAEGKQPKEIVSMLKKEASSVAKMQEEAIDDLMNVRVVKIEQNIEKRVKQIIDSVDNDKTKIKLDNFWVALSSQVKQRLYKSIAKARGNMIESTIQDNDELAKMLQMMTGAKNLNVKIKEYEKVAKSELEKANSSEGEETSGEESSGEETTNSGDSGEEKIEKSKESFEEDISNEGDHDKLIVLGKDVLKSKLGDEEKKTLLKSITGKGVKAEELK